MFADSNIKSRENLLTTCENSNPLRTPIPHDIFIGQLFHPFPFISHVFYSESIQPLQNGLERHFMGGSLDIRQLHLATHHMSRLHGGVDTAKAATEAQTCGPNQCTETRSVETLS